MSTISECGRGGELAAGEAAAGLLQHCLQQQVVDIGGDISEGNDLGKFGGVVEQICGSGSAVRERGVHCGSGQGRGW